MEPEQNVNIGEILNIDAARVDELIQACYNKMDEVRQANSDSPLTEVINFMKSLGKNEQERFLAGFILGRVYTLNMDAAKQVESVGAMFH
jgi:hypothetical protein